MRVEAGLQNELKQFVSDYGDKSTSVELVKAIERATAVVREEDLTEGVNVALVGLIRAIRNHIAENAKYYQTAMRVIDSATAKQVTNPKA